MPKQYRKLLYESIISIIKLKSIQNNSFSTELWRPSIWLGEVLCQRNPSSWPNPQKWGITRKFFHKIARKNNYIRLILIYDNWFSSWPTRILSRWPGSGDLKQYNKVCPKTGNVLIPLMYYQFSEQNWNRVLRQVEVCKKFLFTVSLEYLRFRSW